MAGGTQIASPFGVWLKRWRKKRGLTQEALSKLAGNICTAGYISALERGKEAGKKGQQTRAREEIVEALARAMNVSVSEARVIAGYSERRASTIATTTAPDGAQQVKGLSLMGLPRLERGTYCLGVR